MSSIMTSRQAAELDFALERNGWTAEDVKEVSGGELLTSLLLVVRGRAEVVVKSILTFLYKVEILPQLAATTSTEYWKKVGVKWMGESFKVNCLNISMKAVSRLEAAVHKLEEGSADKSILTERGEKARIPLSQIAAFLATRRGSSEWYIFYPEELPDWAVSAYWHVSDGGWRVGALSVTYPSGWSAGGHVVSRN